MTLYALHQQGNEENMHREGVSVGKAAAIFAKQENDSERIRKRLNIVVTAESPEDFAYHLRAVIKLLSGKSIGLDYAILAKSLYKMYFDDSAVEVITSWGREFFREYNFNTKGKDKENKNEQ